MPENEREPITIAELVAKFERQVNRENLPHTGKISGVIIHERMSQTEAAMAIAYMLGSNGTVLEPVFGYPTLTRTITPRNNHDFHTALGFVADHAPPVAPSEDGKIITRSGRRYRLEELPEDDF